MYTAVNAILAPNDESANNMLYSDLADGLYTAGSYHPGKIMVTYVDGSVHALDTQIDNGDLLRPIPKGHDSGPSPYGVWGATSTIANGETNLDAQEQ